MKRFAVRACMTVATTALKVAGAALLATILLETPSSSRARPVRDERPEVN